MVDIKDHLKLIYSYLNMLLLDIDIYFFQLTKYFPQIKGYLLIDKLDSIIPSNHEVVYYDDDFSYYKHCLNAITAIEEDYKHYKKIGINLKDQNTTIACQIMDEADRNSYVCSDLIDFFCLGYKIDLNELKELLSIVNSEDEPVGIRIHLVKKNDVI